MDRRRNKSWPAACYHPLSFEARYKRLPKAGLLTHRSSRFGNLPIPQGTVVLPADSLAAHSGATVRDLHPLPFSPAVTGGHLGTDSMNTTLQGSDQMFPECRTDELAWYQNSQGLDGGVLFGERRSRVRRLKGLTGQNQANRKLS
jgi:hypothetical protein